MPKDKTGSRIKIDKAIREEFLEKGYEAASIRSIATRAGMTSAALYRHYKDKDDMFASLVTPLVEEMDEWMERHEDKKYDMLSKDTDDEVLFEESFIDLVREVILPKREEFRLIFTGAKGSAFENFIHDFVEKNQGKLLKAINYMKDNGYPAQAISEEELHMLLSAYLTALFEPIIHGYDDRKIEKYLERINDFFSPGWKKIMGLKA